MVIRSLISVINLCDSLNVDAVLYVDLIDNMFYFFSRNFFLHLAS